MRKILLAAVILVVPQAVFAQAVGTKDRITRTPYSVFEKRFARIVVIAQEAELRDGIKAVGTIERSTFVQIHESDVAGYQVRWEGKDAWINRWVFVMSPKPPMRTAIIGLRNPLMPISTLSPMAISG